MNTGAGCAFTEVAPADSGAWKLRPLRGVRPAVTCEACGKQKGGA